MDADNDPSNDGALSNNVAGDVWGMALGYYDGDFNRTNSRYNSGDAGMLTPCTIHAKTKKPPSNIRRIQQ